MQGNGFDCLSGFLLITEIAVIDGLEVAVELIDKWDNGRNVEAFQRELPRYHQGFGS